MICEVYMRAWAGTDICRCIYVCGVMQICQMIGCIKICEEYVKRWLRRCRYLYVYMCVCGNAQASGIQDKHKLKRTQSWDIKRKYTMSPIKGIHTGNPGKQREFREYTPLKEGRKDNPAIQGDGQTCDDATRYKKNLPKGWGWDLP